MTTSLNLTKPRGKAAPALALTATTVLATVLSAGAAGAAPAATKPASRSAMNVSISESGSTLLEPLFDQWANGYHKHNGTVTVTPSGGGSGKGISDAIAGTVDIGASDAYVSGSDRSENKGLQDIALAISSQMVNYNIKGLAAGTHLQLSGTVLSAAVVRS